MNKLDLLHLSHTDIRCDSRILKELECLHSEGYNVAALGVSFDEGLSFGEPQSAINIQILSLVFNKLRFINYCPKIIVYILIVLEIFFKFTKRAVILKPKVIHVHDTLALPAAWLSSVICNSKLVYDAHELESMKNGTTKLGSILTKLVEKFCWSKIDGLIVVSDLIGNWYNENIGRKNTCVIMNSPKTLENTSLYSDNYFRQRYSIPDDSLIFVYVGIIGEGRFIEMFLDHFCSKHVKSHIVFLGYGSLVSLVEKASINHPNIHYHTSVPHSHVSDIIKSADFGLCFLPNVSLSDYYSLPNKFFEYIFAGLNILASDFPEMRTLVNKYNLGYIVEANMESFSDTITKIESSIQLLPVGDRDITDLSWGSQEIKLRLFYRDIIGY